MTYHASPHECVEIVRGLNCPGVKGNHDEYACSTDDLSQFSPIAKKAITWTRKQLADKDKVWLRALKLIRQVSDFSIVHATLDTPHKWGYVFSHMDAALSIMHQHTKLCFFGHTHAPRAYIRDVSIKSERFEKLTVHSDKQYLINSGSVGQPRDGDWHAAYCLYTPDLHLVELRRIEYDIGTAQDKLREAGL